MIIQQVNHSPFWPSLFFPQHKEMKALLMEGVVATEPLTGHFFECTRVKGTYKGSNVYCSTRLTNKTVIDSIFVGYSLEFSPAGGVTHTVRLWGQPSVCVFALWWQRPVKGGMGSSCDP